MARVGVELEKLQQDTEAYISDISELYPLFYGATVAP